MVSRTYDVVALQVPIAYDTWGDHDPNGMIYVLAEDEAELRRLQQEWPEPFPRPIEEPDRLPKPHPLVRPLVLRACVGDQVVVRFRNELPQRAGIHAQGVGYQVRDADGGAVGANPDSSAESNGGRRTYVWDCDTEGVFLFSDIADLRGDEHGSNAHGLFGGLIVEPPGARWTDPETGEPLASGLYADVHVPGEPSFREYALFMHDETHNHNPVPPPHPLYHCDRRDPHTHSLAAGGERLAPDLFGGRPGDHGEGHADGGEQDGPGAKRGGAGHRQGADGSQGAGHGQDGTVSGQGADGGQGAGGGRDGTGDGGDHASMMLMNYRTEPMGWRAFAYERMLQQGRLDPVRDQIVGEEQHHSSWLFGDPATPVLRAYRGDRTRIRLLHAGVKETHVFHLHLHQWRAVPGNDDSPIIDSITIGPQQALTIEPIPRDAEGAVRGAGSIQRATGDVIFHCHLYPHFHAGMWGIWRVFDKLQDGSGRYPDGTPITALRPLPGAEDTPEPPTPEQPGFPSFIPGRFPQKSPRPPRTPGMPEGMGREPTELERAAFCDDPQPGEAFTKVTPENVQAPVRRYHLVVMEAPVTYFDSRGDHRGARAKDGSGSIWHDPRGTFFALQEEVDDAGGVEEFRRELAEGSRQVQPIAIRARKGEVLELTLTNALPPGCHRSTAFDPVLPFQPECGLHVHLVKFDPLVADGSSVGWNYLSGTTTPDQGPEDFERYHSWIYRWYCDEEFGVVFFHDHLLANERQRHGLFGSLIAEPAGAEWVDPHDHDREVRNSNQAVVRLPDGSAFREQVLALGDFVPLFERQHRRDDPINPPHFPGSLDDQGVMAVNYRCEPLHERPGDPADWFSSDQHGDPGTPLLHGYPGETIRLRLYQGSQEEQHSLMMHGMRWRAWRDDPASPLRDQQTLGISEAFSFHIDEHHGPGDYLWSFAAGDDTWLGCWGLFRLHEADQPGLPPLPGRRTGDSLPPFDPQSARRYRVRARSEKEIVYSDQRSDPYGLAFRTEDQPDGEPLVMRCRVGEWVEIRLTNELAVPLQPTPFDPPLPAKDDPGSREISKRVSLHAGLVRYDVRTSDGANVGFNRDGTAGPDREVIYRWYADTPGAVLLQDRADVRTHRHRGLVGALIVEPADTTPDRWVGEQTVLRRQGGPPVHELVLIVQDGMRHYRDGDPAQPVPDLEDEPEDSGQKGINYRSAHLVPTRPTLADPNPPTPLLECRPGDLVRLHLVYGSDKPRNHSFLVHGATWPMEDHLRQPRVGAIGALSAGSVRSLDLVAGQPGDYAYRSGVLRWALTEGVWGLIRVRG